MEKCRKQLTREQRYTISHMHAARISNTEIARVIGVDKSTIGRELKRNSINGQYCPAHAQALCAGRRKGTPRIDRESWLTVERGIALGLSPEQISLRLKKEGIATISHVSIYRHIAADKAQGGSQPTHLRRKKKYRPRQGTSAIRGRVGISERPAVVEERSRIGDWEMDTIVGRNGRQAMVTVVERKSRLTLLAKLPFKGAEVLQEAVVRLLRPFKEQIHTITSDNGSEFARHADIARSMEADYYFADPYASWQRGTNEHHNGLIRQYLPKGCDFDAVDDEKIQWIMDRLNHRPRKCLAAKTPYEVFFGKECPLRFDV